MAKRLEPEMQAATPITSAKSAKNAKAAKATKTELKLTTKGTTMTKATKTAKKGKTPKQDAESTGSKFTQVDANFKLGGVTPKVVTDHFDGMKVSVVSKGKGIYTFSYAARGAAVADIVKRLDGFAKRVAKDDGELTFEYIAPKPKAAAKK